MGSSLVAAELFSAGMCNMDCAYCYIYKNSAMKSINDRIVNKIKTGEYIDELKKVYGTDLTHISFWGTEPTLNMFRIVEFMIDSLLETFPKLHYFMFSTNLLHNTEKIVSLVNKLNTCTDRDIELSIQFSIDGPEWITDINRKPGYADVIVSGYKNAVASIDAIKLRKNFKINTHFKPTVSLNNIQDINKRGGMGPWFEYFDELFDYFINTVTNNKSNFTISLFATPTLVVPGEYTKESGLMYRDFCKELFDLSKKGVSKYQRGSLNNYTNRLNRVFAYQEELGVKSAMFTCSAGDSQLGLNANGSVGMCHRTFYTVEDAYLNLCRDVDSVDRVVEHYIGSKYTAKVDNSLQLNRLNYIQRNYHDFLDFKLAYCDALINELVFAGQMDEDFLDKDLRLLLSLFINTGMSCPGDNLASTGVLYFPITSIFKIWGNGAFQVMLKDYIYWKTRNARS